MVALIVAGLLGAGARAQVPAVDAGFTPVGESSSDDCRRSAFVEQTEIPPDLRQSATLTDPNSGDRAGDSLCPEWIDTDHFRVHYATSGENMIHGWPDTAYRDSLAFYLDHAYRCFHDSLGLPVPLGDGTRGGGVDRIDCYVHRLYNFNAAQAVAEWGGEHGECPRSCRGYLEMSPGLRIGPSLRGIAAHEYFHLVQFGIANRGDWWFEESTAMWSMKAAWPGDTEYMQDMVTFVSEPYRELTAASNLHDYGAGCYWVLLEETQGRSLIVELWKRYCQEEWLPVLDGMLREAGSSFDQSLVQLALWCNATGKGADYRHYRDARLYPQVRCQAEHRVLPVAGASIRPEVLAEAAGSNFIRFFGPGIRDTLCVTVDGDPSLRDKRRISLVATVSENRHTEWTLSPDTSGNVTMMVPNWSACDYVTLIVTNFLEAHGDLRFQYSAREVGPVVPVSATNLECVPNPFIGQAEIRFRCKGEPQDASLTIFDSRGVQVRAYPLQRRGRGEIRLVWDGRDERSRAVPCGCYYVRARFGSSLTTGKIVRVR